MSPAKGQKVKEDPINKLIHFRANQETMEQLEYVSKENDMSKSEVIRRGIEMQYRELKK